MSAGRQVNERFPLRLSCFLSLLLRPGPEVREGGTIRSWAAFWEARTCDGHVRGEPCE